MICRHKLIMCRMYPDDLAAKELESVNRSTLSEFTEHEHHVIPSVALEYISL
jgi:hypothetical protein